MLPSIFLIIFLAILQFDNSLIYTCDHRAACGCSNRSQIYSKIVGGQNANAHTWSWVVSLRLRNRFYCAGSILSNSWIVTAAHCFAAGNEFGTDVIRIKPSDITVHAGSINQYEFSQVRRVMKIIFHEDFDELTFVNDIALLQLSSPFSLDDLALAKICLPWIGRNEYPPVDSSLVAVGWGRLWEKGPESSILQQIIIKTIDAQDSSCSPLIFNQSKQFCAGVENSKKDTCQGDSGGPLMIFTSSEQWVLVGLTSFGFGCAQPGYSGVYTRIPAYVNWINSFINNSDNSMYPYSLLPNTPFADDDLRWNLNQSIRPSMPFLSSLMIAMVFSQLNSLL